MIETDLDEDELALYSLFMDESGIDQMELTWFDGSTNDGCFRTWPVQFWWWRIKDPFVISAGCIAEDHLVLTSRGLIEIQNVRIGDYVLTHKNRWRKVSNVIDSGIKKVVAVHSQGSPRPLYATHDHRFWGSHVVRSSQPKDGHKRKKILGPEWIRLNEWIWNDNSQKMTTNLSRPATVEPLDFDRYLTFARGVNYRQNYINDTLDEDWLWLYGLYIAEGSLSGDRVSYKRIQIDIHELEFEEVSRRLDKLELNYQHYPNKNDRGYRIHINSAPLFDWLEKYGHRGSHNKEIAPWVYGLEYKYRKAVFDGATYGDGYIKDQEKDQREYSTTSIKLIYSLGLLATTLGYSDAPYCVPAPTKEIFIGERQIFPGLSYGSLYQPVSNQAKSRFMFYGDKAFIAPNKIEDQDLYMHTWDLEVEEDHSFVVDGFIVHNSRSVGKSLSCVARAYAFPFVYAGEEMVITAPDGDRLTALTDKIETVFMSNWVANAMLPRGQRGNIKHRPFHINFANTSRIMGRIPRHDGTGMQGSKKAGSLVLTRDRGLVEIENVTTNDYVWTHNQRWRPVIYTYELPEQAAFEVRGQGAIPLTVNDDHRFYVRNDVSKQPGKTKRKLGEFRWEYVNDLSSSKYGGINSYWTSPTNFGEELDIEYPNYSGCKTSYEMNEDFWWIVGRYLADGSIHGTSQMSITAPEKKEEELIKRFDSLEIKFNKRLKESGAFTYSFNNAGLARWLEEYFNRHSHHKTMPTWVFTMRREYRQALLDGYLSGDGCAFYHGTQNRYSGSSVSKKLALSIGTLAHTLGYHVGYGYNQPTVTEICGMELKKKPALRYLWRINQKGDGYVDSDIYINYKIRSVTQVEDCKFYGIVVEEDHSYFADGVIHHNTHPIVLIQDESSTYPERGWKEVIETVEIGKTGGRWLSYGVTMGPGNTFDDIINGKDPDWTVVKLPAMYRPTWSDEERQIKINKYGGYESLDYKRNILGTAVGADASLLSLTRLMGRNMDQDEMSDFNTSEYYSIEVTDAMLAEVDDILDLIDPPITHTQYKKTWIGMDYGLTTSKSCILVFSEEKVNKESSERLKLVARIMMSRIPTKDQVEVIKHIMSIYRPIGFGFDAHGVGQPAYEWLQEEVRRDHDLSWMIDRMKGYSFSENIVWDLDDKIEYDPNIKDDWKKAALVRKTSDYSLDILRLVVDTDKLWLPYDDDVIGELRAVPRKDLMTMDEYGKPKRKQGGHILDAFRFALLSWKQQPVEQIVHKLEEDTYELPGLMMLDFA